MKLLLASGAAVNQRCHRGWTALHEAARRDNVQLCQKLLQARATIDTRNADDVTPTIEAARHGRTEALAYLIQNGTERYVFAFSLKSSDLSHLLMRIVVDSSSNTLILMTKNTIFSCICSLIVNPTLLILIKLIFFFNLR